MSSSPERTDKHPIVTRHFESSRHQRSNLVAAFEYALPVIRRTPKQEPVPRDAGISPRTQRRAVS
jgi:hypothetical protein